MKIVNYKIEKIPLKLMNPIKVTFGTIEEVETVLVQLETEEGLCGIGEASPFSPVTGENIDTVTYVIKQLCESIIGLEITHLESIHEKMNQSILGNSSAKAGIDIALHDLIGKKFNVPLYKLLGGYSNHLISDITLGIDTPEIMADNAQKCVEQGKNTIKLKAGINIQNDMEIIKAIRNKVGNQVHIRVDANQGWSVKEALQYIKETENYNIEAIEQPLPYWDIEGMTFLTSQSSIPIMADESIHNSHDAINIVKSRAADLLNIKLMKSGGLYNGSKINTIAEASGLECMVGCMLESVVGITAGASLVAAKKNITKADLDSILHIQDTGIKGGVSFEGEKVLLPEKPGLGIDLTL